MRLYRLRCGLWSHYHTEEHIVYCSAMRCSSRTTRWESTYLCLSSSFALHGSRAEAVSCLHWARTHMDRAAILGTVACKGSLSCRYIERYIRVYQIASRSMLGSLQSLHHTGRNGKLQPWKL